MSQKVQIYRNTNELSKTFGKYYVRAVYDEKFITTAELADYIQTQCTVKRSDCKATLDELGAAFKHYFELGQKIRLDNIGIFKVGITSAPSDSLAGCGASSVKKSRVLFQPETSAIATGETVSVKRARLVDGVPTLVTTEMATYSHPVVMLKDVRFELAQNALGSGFDDDGDAGGGTGGSTGGGDDEPRP